MIADKPTWCELGWGSIHFETMRVVAKLVSQNQTPPTSADRVVNHFVSHGVCMCVINNGSKHLLAFVNQLIMSQNRPLCAVVGNN